MEDTACVVCGAAAIVYCENDKALLCKECDLSIHSSNCLASKHRRVPICDLCNCKAASVFCKNDRAFLCEGCDTTIHQSNPLAARHEVIPAHSAYCEHVGHSEASYESNGNVYLDRSAGHSETRNTSNCEDGACSLPDMDLTPQLSAEAVKLEAIEDEHFVCSAEFGKDVEAFDLDNNWLDRLELFYNCSDNIDESEAVTHPLSGNCDMFEHSAVYCKNAQDLCDQVTPIICPMQSSGPGKDVGLGVVDKAKEPDPKSSRGLTRRQRVLRYLEKRKSRKFQKTIRYASRKAYAEIRPRIKGRFVKKEDLHKYSSTMCTAVGLQRQVAEEGLWDVALTPDMLI